MTPAWRVSERSNTRASWRQQSSGAGWSGLAPFIAEALAVGLVFATGKQWWLALGVASVFATVLILIRLILSGETNTLLDGPSRHAAAAADQATVGPVTAATGIAGALS